MKRIAVLQDLSCYGTCSMTVALPVLSAAGYESVPLPLVLLSTHTAYPDPAIQPLTDFARAASAQWAALHAQFDAILIGYLGSGAAVSAAIDFVKKFRRPGTLVILDPAMADHGCLYDGLPVNYPHLLLPLCRLADYLLPNPTEAALLLDKSLAAPLVPDAILPLLAALNAPNIILTGVASSQHDVGLVWRDAAGDTGQLFHPATPGRFHGTGDLFTVVFTAALLRDLPLEPAVRIAARFTALAVSETAAYSRDPRNGLVFQPLLHGLSALLDNPA